MRRLLSRLGRRSRLRWRKPRPRAKRRNPPATAQLAAPRSRAAPRNAQATQPAAPAHGACRALQAAPAAAAPATSPVPSSEIAVTGWVDFGYRWRTDVGGSFDAYRCLVNLGSGPKLLGTEFSIDRSRSIASSTRSTCAPTIGATTLTRRCTSMRARRSFTTSTRTTATSPTSTICRRTPTRCWRRGIVLNEQSFDTRRRFANFELTLLPGNWISPYLAYDRDSGGGTGVSDFVSNGNEFPVPAQFHDRTSNFRGGVRLEFRRFHATLEQGGTWFEDDQTLYQSGGVNYGNSPAPIFGQTLDLTDLLGAYGAHGTSIYSKGLVTASPVSWLDLYGQFLYSQPKTTVNYQQYDGGNLYLQSQILFYTGQQYLISSAAQMPHTTGNVGRRDPALAARSHHRIVAHGPPAQCRLFAADSDANLRRQTLDSRLTALLESSLVTNYNQAEAMLFFDATSKLTLRGGYRYVWGDAQRRHASRRRASPASDNVQTAAQRGHRRIHLPAAFRSSRSPPKARAHRAAARISAPASTTIRRFAPRRAIRPPDRISFSADFSLSQQSRPATGNQLRLSVASGVALGPVVARGRQDIRLSGSYSRSDLRSDIDYL